MIPHTQKYKHDPENGVYGDCARACFASILDMDLEEVPHFFDAGVSADDGNLAIMDFLIQRGHRLIKVLYPGEVSFDDLMTTLHHTNPGVHFLLTGKSKSGVNHVVICKDGKIVHDPSQTQSGIVGPASDGFWWVEFIGADV